MSELSLLIAFDGSPSAATAVRAAASLFPGARAFVANVPRESNVLRVALPALPAVSPEAVRAVVDELVTEAQREANETAGHGVERARALGLEAEAITLGPAAPAWEVLLEAAGTVGADVLACGTRGRGPFARALLGSTSSGLLHSSRLPLLVVPDGGGALDGPVVAAYDGSDGAGRAIDAIGRLMGGRRAVVVHAWDPAFHRGLTVRALEAGPLDEIHEIVDLLDGWDSEQASAITDDGVARARAAGLEAAGDTVEASESIWRAVAAAARAHGASVLAVGSRGRGAARSALLGSVSSGLVHNAELPILVVPDGG
jgi:nucleotide-binding universal stress UspA family protein